MSSASVALWGKNGKRDRSMNRKMEEKPGLVKMLNKQKEPQNEESPEQKLRGNYEKPICNLTKKRR